MSAAGQRQGPRRSAILVARLAAVGFQIGPAPDQDCPTCTHHWGNHLLRADNTGDPLGGGTVACPYQDCECDLLWALTGEQQAMILRQRAERGE